VPCRPRPRRRATPPVRRFFGSWRFSTETTIPVSPRRTGWTGRPPACASPPPGRAKSAPRRRPPRDRSAATTPPAALPAAAAVGLFLTPGACIAAYATWLGGGNFREGASQLLTRVSAGYLQLDLGGPDVPAVDAEVDVLDGGRPLFAPLFDWYRDLGGVYKLAFGPKAFLVVSDPQVARHILREQPMLFSKARRQSRTSIVVGPLIPPSLRPSHPSHPSHPIIASQGVLAEILEDIMGKGLIPADLETWKVRRRAIVPAFHAAFLNRAIAMFGDCSLRTVAKLDEALAGAAVDGLLTRSVTESVDEDDPESLGLPVLDMETEFLNVALDIIGLGVFNYDFGSVNTESPVIKAVYGVLREAEHRSTFYVPYWQIPGNDLVVPRQREFKRQMSVISEALDGLIDLAKATRNEDDASALQEKDYDSLKDPSILRFLVDSRGEDISNQQLRDDLMTMLIAGHETTAAALTWTFFCLAQAPDKLEKLWAEVDSVLDDLDAPIDLDTIKRLDYTRACVSESLRLYPQPPFLIRRATEDMEVPWKRNPVSPDRPIVLKKGSDIFVSVWNLHRSPEIWGDDVDVFRPERMRERRIPDASSPLAASWSGFDPARTGSGGGPPPLYPNETVSDFAYLPFGGGNRRCVGDQFAVFEAVVILATLARRFDFKLATPPEDVGLTTGATIHTKNGLKMTVRARPAWRAHSKAARERVAAA